MNDKDHQKHMADLKWRMLHRPFVETHYVLICPVCKQKCHSLYVLGLYPDDKLACKKCVKAAIPISEQEKEILLHSLGISDPSRCEEPYRNYYCTIVGDPLLTNMVEKGLMEESTVINGGMDQYFTVSEYGREIAMMVKPKPLSREKKRYRDYLQLSETWTDLTFFEYLKQRLYIGRIE